MRYRADPRYFGFGCQWEPASNLGMFGARPGIFNTAEYAEAYCWSGNDAYGRPISLSSAPLATVIEG